MSGHCFPWRRCSIEILDDLSSRLQVSRVLGDLAAGASIYRKGIHPDIVKRAVDYLIDRAVIEKTARCNYVFVELMFRDYILGAP